MSRGSTKLISASGGKGYDIEQSLMFDVTDNSYLKRDYGSSANSYKKWTFSTWIKYDSTNYSGGTIWGSWDNSTQADTSYGWIGFYQDALQVGGWFTNWRVTNRKFRDVSAWMHLVVAVDTTIADGSADNRIRIYINGVEETSFSTKNNPSQNTELPWNKNQQHRLGAINGSTAYYFGGYLAETQVIDGSQLTPSSFGETDSVTGQWIPKKYTGTYSGYSFYLPFKKNDRYSPYFTGANTTGIAVADSTDWDFGSGDFTMEAWVYRHEDLGQTGYIMGQCSSSTGANAGCGAFLLVGTNNQAYCYAIDASNTNNYITLTGGSIADNKWYHIAVSRNSSTWKLFVDGTAVATVTSSITVNNVGDVFGVGKLGVYTAGHWQGWISNARVVKGTAVYTSDFTPSTTPLTAVTNTVLLCCQDQNVTTDNSGTSKSLSVTAAQTYTQQMSPFTYDWYQDQSGQDNHYQADNITVNDVMLDTPTNNFAVINSLSPLNANNLVPTLTQGNLKAASNQASHYVRAVPTIAPTSGKWYWEVKLIQLNLDNGNGYIQIQGSPVSYIYSYYDTPTTKIRGWNGDIATVSNWSANDVIMIACDMDNSKVWYGINGSWYNTGGTANPATGADEAADATEGWQGRANGNPENMRVELRDGSGTNIVELNYGQKTFAHTPPSGFKAINTSNLPTPTIKKPTEHFNTILYTGDDSTSNAITGVGFQSGFTWIKNRSAGNNHILTDAVRGATKTLFSDSNAAELTVAQGLKSFDSDGFTVGFDSSDIVNGASNNYVAWNWKAGGSGSTNGDGAQTTTVSANTTAGFSIATATGTGSSTTYGHGLGVSPKVVILKYRSQTGSWYVFTTAIDGSTDYLLLESTNGKTDSSPTWDSSTVTTAFASGSTFVMYSFAEVEGFSKFSSFTGNGSTNGPFVNTGFRPAWIMIKKTASGTGSWFIWDSKREKNPHTTGLWADGNYADTTHSTYEIDLLSNGFKLRGTNVNQNGDGTIFFYAAFAEFPFSYSNAR